MENNSNNSKGSRFLQGWGFIWLMVIGVVAVLAGAKILLAS